LITRIWTNQLKKRILCSRFYNKTKEKKVFLQIIIIIIKYHMIWKDILINDGGRKIINWIYKLLSYFDKLCIILNHMLKIILEEDLYIEIKVFNFNFCFYNFTINLFRIL